MAKHCKLIFCGIFLLFFLGLFLNVLTVYADNLSTTNGDGLDWGNIIESFRKNIKSVQVILIIFFALLYLVYKGKK